jgi:hypothetical protein
MLPTAKIKPDWAIYGNTASFIIDRFKDGHVSAGAANCEYVLVMVLDDVGTLTRPPNMPAASSRRGRSRPRPARSSGVTSSACSHTKAEFAAAIKRRG